MFGGDGAAEFDGAAGELKQEVRSLRGIRGIGKYVDVNVSVADVAEDDIPAGEFRVHAAAVVRQHLAIARERDGVIGMHLDGSAAATVSLTNSGSEWRKWRKRSRSAAEVANHEASTRAPADWMRSSQWSTSGSSSAVRSWSKRMAAPASAGISGKRARNRLSEGRSMYSSMRGEEAARQASTASIAASSARKKTTPANTAAGAGSRRRVA